MPIPLAVPAIISGLGALGGLFGNRKSVQEQQHTSQNRGSQTSYGGTSGASSTSTMGRTTPIVTPQRDAATTQLLDRYFALLQEDPNLTGYQTGAINDINRVSDIRNRNIEETLAARGIFGPAVGTALAGSEGQRTGEITKLNQSIPLLKNELIQQLLRTGGDLTNLIPYGQESQQTGYQEQFNNFIEQMMSEQSGSSTGTNTQPGNMLGGLFQNLSPILAFLYGQGAFNKPQVAGAN